jgi:hypothetical protein
MKISEKMEVAANACGLAYLELIHKLEDSARFARSRGYLGRAEKYTEAAEKIRVLYREHF